MIKAWWAVTLREVTHYRMLWPAALTLGLLSIASAVLSSRLGYDVDITRDAMPMAAAILLCLFAMAGLGFRLLANDLNSRRLAFLLVRPIPAAALWLGKLTAAAVLICGVFLLTLLPSILAGGRPQRSFDLLASSLPSLELWSIPVPWFWQHVVGKVLWLGPSQAEYFELSLVPTIAVCSLGIFLLCHVLGVSLIRPRRWTLIDLIAVCVFALAFSGLAARLAGLGATARIAQGAGLLFAALCFVCLLSGWLQIRLAGTDRLRSHAVLSCLLWSTCLCFLIGLEMNYRQIANLELEDFDRLVEVIPAPRGPWLVATGFDVKSSTLSTFAVHRDSMEQVRLGPRGALHSSPLFSADGRRLFWENATASSPSWLDLDQRPLRIREILGLSPSPERCWVLDATGNWAASLLDTQVEVIELATSRVLWRRVLPQLNGIRVNCSDTLALLSPHEVRVTLQSTQTPRDARTEIWLLEASQNAPRLVETLPGSWPRHTYLRPDRLQLRRRRDEPFIVNLKGQPIYTPISGNAPLRSLVRMLDDERLFVVAKRDLRVTYHVLPAPSAAQAGSETLEPLLQGEVARWIYPAGEPAPGWLLVGAGPSVHDLAARNWPKGWQTWVFEVATGTVHHKIENHAPLPLDRGPGEPGADWLIDEAGFPKRVDLESGALSSVLGKSTS